MASRGSRARRLGAVSQAVRGQQGLLPTPLAQRLGLSQTYRELQELSFKYISPWRYGILAKAVKPCLY